MSYQVGDRVVEIITDKPKPTGFVFVEDGPSIDPLNLPQRVSLEYGGVEQPTEWTFPLTGQDENEDPVTMTIHVWRAPQATPRAGTVISTLETEPQTCTVLFDNGGGQFVCNADQLDPEPPPP